MNIPDFLVDHDPAGPHDVCTCGRPAEFLIGATEGVPFCGEFDADTDAHGTDDALLTALDETSSAASAFLAQVPAATLAAAVRTMARNHPEEAAMYEQWATQLDREADTEALARSVGFFGGEQAVSR